VSKEAEKEEPDSRISTGSRGSQARGGKAGWSELRGGATPLHSSEDWRLCHQTPCSDVQLSLMPWCRWRGHSTPALYWSWACLDVLSAGSIPLGSVPEVMKVSVLGPGSCSHTTFYMGKV
jgi:hypothetical protein